MYSVHHSRSRPVRGTSEQTSDECYSNEEHCHDDDDYDDDDADDHEDDDERIPPTQSHFIFCLEGLKSQPVFHALCMQV